MRTIRNYTLLAGLALLGACTPAPTLQERLGYLVGQTEGGLVGEMGVPTRTYEAEGKRFLEYEQVRTVAQPAPSPWVMTPWGMRPGYGPSYYYRPAQCQITFTLIDGRVRGFAARGDAC